MSLAPGTRLGPYEILSPIGAGGMGEVYKARDPRLGRDVAIKVLPASVAGDPSRLHRFEQEARAVADARRLLGELDDRESRGEYVAPIARLAIHAGLDDIPNIRAALAACVADATPIATVKIVCGAWIERYRSDSEIDRLCHALFGTAPRPS